MSITITADQAAQLPTLIVGWTCPDHKPCDCGRFEFFHCAMSCVFVRPEGLILMQFADADKPCSTCDGGGLTNIHFAGPEDHYHEVGDPCSDCHGTGRKVVALTLECQCERRRIGGGAGWYDHATDCPVRLHQGFLREHGQFDIGLFTIRFCMSINEGDYMVTATKVETK